jgi:hypothetical protein
MAAWKYTEPIKHSLAVGPRRNTDERKNPNVAED